MKSILTATLVATALVALAGCSERHGVTGPDGLLPPPPDPVSPQAVVRLFEWSWNYRSLDHLAETLSGDFRFVFAQGDSAGNQFRDHSMDRQQLLDCAGHLFFGSATEPPATSIVLHFDPTLRPVDDSRPGRNPRWHKEIVTSVDLDVRTELKGYRITGYARFFVVRGDSALIPPDLVARGFHPDATRWYIQQWNDETLVVPTGVPRAPAARALPANHVTWGKLLALYR